MSELPWRFWSKVQFGHDCWTWTGARTTGGYGLFAYDGGTAYVHRLIYELTTSPLVHPLQIDHLCRNRACVRPSHLEAVTPRENSLRGEGIPAVNARKTHCKNGHPYDEANTYLRPDRKGRGRNCRPCKLEQNKQALARKRAGV